MDIVSAAVLRQGLLLLCLVYVGSTVDTRLNQGVKVINDLQYPVNSLFNNGNLYPMGGKQPSKRVFQSISLANNYILVYGGYAEDGTLLDDINMYDTRIFQWSGPIMKRQCCSEDGHTVDTLAMDESLANNSDINTLKFHDVGFAGTIPKARAEHAVCTVNDIMYMFGGITSPYGYTNDFHSFDTVNLEWNVLSGSVTNIPSRRAGHNMVHVPGTSQFVLFGGAGRGTSRKDQYLSVGFNDVWLYDTDAYTWTQLTAMKTTSETPAGRHHASAAVNDNILYIFGGINPANNYTYNDMWAFDLGLLKWEQLSGNNGNTAGFKPPPLYNSYMFYLENVDKIIIYGGIGGGGSCGDVVCNMLELTLGQVYTFSVTEGAWNIEILLSDSGIVQGKYIAETAFTYARLTTDSSTNYNDHRRDDNKNRDRGRLRKYFALESCIYDSERQLMYEFGGIETVAGTSIRMNNEVTMKNGTNDDPPAFDTSGGILENSLWDLTTNEGIKQNMNLPVNSEWVYDDAFRRIQPQTDETELKFLRSFRTYRVTDNSDVVLLMHQDEN